MTGATLADCADMLADPAFDQALDKLRCERSFRTFVRAAWPIVEPSVEFVDNWHIGLLCRKLEAMADKRLMRWVCNLPPATMKSILVAVLWPAWVWTTRPERRFLCGSYSGDLAVRDSLNTRKVLRSAWYQRLWGDKVRLLRDADQKTLFANEAGGWRMATSPGGRGTGEHPDHVVFDDPHKVKEAESAQERIRAVEWWRGTISSRGITRDVTRLVCGQRTHEEDVSGHAIGQGAYEVTCFPMRYEAGHPYVSDEDERTEEGELLWPTLLPEPVIDEMAAEMGPIRAAGQIQQRPAAKGGALFKEAHFRYFRIEADTSGEEPRDVFVLDVESRRVWADECLWFQAADTATKTDQDNDYTAVITLALTPTPVRLLVVHVFRDKLEVPRQYGALVAQLSKYPQVQFMGVEDKSSGTGIIQEGRLHGVPFRPLKPGTQDKVQRATAIVIAYQNETVYHRTSAQAPWLGAFEDELTSFPMGAHDDQVDCMSYAGMLAQGRRGMSVRGQASIVGWPPPKGGEEEPDGKRTESLAERLAGGRRPARAGVDEWWK